MRTVILSLLSLPLALSLTACGDDSGSSEPPPRDEDPIVIDYPACYDLSNYARKFSDWRGVVAPSRANYFDIFGYNYLTSGAFTVDVVTFAFHRSVIDSSFTEIDLASASNADGRTVFAMLHTDCYEDLLEQGQPFVDACDASFMATAGDLQIGGDFGFDGNIEVSLYATQFQAAYQSGGRWHIDYFGESHCLGERKRMNFRLVNGYDEFTF